MEEQHGIASNSKVLIQMKILYLQPISVAVGISVLLSLLSHAAVTVSSRILSHIDKSNHQPITNAFVINIQLLPIQHCFSCNSPSGLRGTSVSSHIPEFLKVPCDCWQVCFQIHIKIFTITAVLNFYAKTIAIHW